MGASFVTILLSGIICAMAIVVISDEDVVGKIALACTSVLLGLSVIEICLYRATRSQTIITKTVPDGWRQDAMTIGPLPLPNTTTEFEEFLDGRMIANANYRIDRNRLREIPAQVQGSPYKVAFFGCSFMFGHGLRDDQTLPYYFIEAARGTFEGFNFAGEGWGPHQMLREIETGFVKQVAGAPALAIYEAIPDHLRRVSGRAPWESGPKYNLCQGDGVCYSGPFHSNFYRIMHHWLEKSCTVRFLEKHLTEPSQPSDIPLFLAVLKRARSLLEESGTEFVIVLWDQNDLARVLLEALRADQFKVITLSSIAPNADHTKNPVTLSDGHPTPAANKVIATYLWKQLGQRILEQHPR
jgi:hypothetical protein